MLEKQRGELERIETFLKNSVGKTDKFGSRDWTYLIGCETRTRQAFEVAKANHRSAGRATMKIDYFAKPFKDNKKVQELGLKLRQSLEQADLIYVELEKVVPTILKQIQELENLRPED